jgi:group II intron reverse transcriptase/maturase
MEEHGMTKRGTDDQGTRSREGEAGHHQPGQGNAEATPKAGSVSTKLARIAEMAQESPDMKFRNLAHLLRPEYLYTCALQLNPDSVPGLDGITAEDYKANLCENIIDLHERLRTSRYRATPVERVYIEKDGGGQRPLGLPVFEDKIVQRGVVGILESIYEQDFYDCSHGFRKGHNQHQALGEFRESCLRKGVGWVVDMDIKGYFDAINHEHLMEFLERRIADPRMLQLIGKWLKAGVVEDGELRLSPEGTPQGGVISPLLANVYLHYVLDEWFDKDIRPCLNGEACMVRFADDALLGFSSEQDARRFMKVLPKRFGKFGLTIHPEKTKLVKFRFPGAYAFGEPNGTFDFLGFTHYWGKTLNGSWTIKRRTSSKKLRSKMSAIWQWCKTNRHWSIKEQHAILCSKLRGHYQYYGVRCNMRSLEKFREHVRYCWKRWLGRRHRNGHIRWDHFVNNIEKHFPLPRPKIVHSI